MTALLIAGVFALALTITGAGLAREARPDSHGPGLSAALALAGVIVLAGDASSLWGFHWWAVILIAAAIALIGWFTSMRRTPALLHVRPPKAETIGLGLLALALAVPLLIFPVPLDTDAQGFGYQALMIRDGGTLDSLAPWHPEIATLYAPGALIVFATLSKLFPSAPLSAVMMGAAHAAAFLFVCVAWEFGGEIAWQRGNTHVQGQEITSVGMSTRWRWACGISAALSVGLWTALLDSHYTAVFGLLFTLATITCLLRYQRRGKIADAFITALAAAGTVITHADSAIGLALAVGAWMLLSPLATDRPRLKRWLIAALAIPLTAAAMIAPWLVSLRPLLQAGARSPFPVSAEHWRVLILNHGLVWPLLALLGAIVLVRSRRTWALMMVGWLALTVELSMFGIPESAFPWLGATLLRFDFPFSLAWHAPIIPYLALGAGALVTLADRHELSHLRRWSVPLALATAGLLVAIPILQGPLLHLSRGYLHFFGAFATADDVAAMRWLHDHAPSEARVLNYPGDYLAGRDWEAHWAPAIAERDCVYFRRQPFFLGPAGEPIDASNGYPEQLELLAFWRDPANPANQRLLHEAGIQFVLVPESVGDPGSLQRSWRWQPPALFPDSVSQPSQAPYLALAFSSGGAQVFRVLP